MSRHQQRIYNLTIPDELRALGVKAITFGTVETTLDAVTVYFDDDRALEQIVDQREQRMFGGPMLLAVGRRISMWIRRVK